MEEVFSGVLNPVPLRRGVQEVEEAAALSGLEEQVKVCLCGWRASGKQVQELQGHAAEQRLRIDSTHTLAVAPWELEGLCCRRSSRGGTGGSCETGDGGRSTCIQPITELFKLTDLNKPVS